MKKDQGVAVMVPQTPAFFSSLLASVPLHKVAPIPGLSVFSSPSLQLLGNFYLVCKAQSREQFLQGPPQPCG